MKCALYDPAGRAGALPPPTSPDNCPAITEEPAADYHVIASRKAAWQSPAPAVEIRTVYQKIGAREWKMPPEKSGGIGVW